MALTRNRLRALSAATLLAAWAWAAAPAMAGDCGCPGACDGGCQPACGHGPGCDCAPACDGCEHGCDGCCEKSCNKGCCLSGIFDSCLSGGCDECGGGGCDECGGGCKDTSCCMGFEFSGWLTQSYTWNPDNPQIFPFNGPVTFTDRANEYQMNQLYLVFERALDDETCGWQWGGRADVLYGTDARFTFATGLDDEIISDEDSRFYKLAFPQLYAEFAYNDFAVKIGHFYTIIGYEVVQSTGNFFITHSYNHQYGEPFTHTGFLTSYQLNDSLTIYNGLTRGWDNWEDVNDEYDYLGGVTWTMDDNTSLAVALTTGPQDPAGVNDRTMYSVVYVSQFGDCCDPEWTYILDWNQGWEENTGLGGGDADFYGIGNYLLYTINDCWEAGVRYNWFSDKDGTRVSGLGIPRGWPGVAVPSDWQTISAALRYTPNDRCIIRSEVRWDWVDPLVAVPPPGIPGHGPFDDFLDQDQFLWVNDITFTW